jgi:hypothetical protein
MECLDCKKPDHSSISCKCICHWPSGKDTQDKIASIFKNVEHYTDDRINRILQFHCTADVSSIMLVRFINLMFSSYNTFPVFHIDVPNGSTTGEELSCTLTFSVRY